MKTFTNFICNYFSILLILIAFPLALSAQCPAGETEITLDFNGSGAFPSEVSFDLSDGTTIYASIDCGLFVGDGTSDDITVCVPDNTTLTLSSYDDYGDGWNGELLTILISEDGTTNGCAVQTGCVVLSEYGPTNDLSGDSAYDCISDLEGTETFSFACDATVIDGCTDPLGINFDACATVDDGSCIICANTTNNDCGTKLDLGLVGAPGSCVPIVADFTCSTASADALLPSCDATGINLDLFYQFTAPAGGDVLLSVTNGTNIEFAIFDDCPGVGTEIFCTNNTNTGDQELISGLTAGSDYTLMAWVDDFNVNTVTFCLEESDCNNPNNDCVGATDLGTVGAAGTCDGYTVTGSGDFFCATSSADAQTPSCDTTTGNLDLFFTFTAPPNGSVVYTGVTGNNAEIAIYDGGCPSIGTEIFCIANTDADESVIFSGLTAGNVYTMQMWVDDFNVNQIEFCLEEAAPAPPEDVCAGAIELLVSTTACSTPSIGNNSFASDSGELPAPGCASYQGGDIWFFATVPPSGNITIETSDAGGFTDSGLTLYSGTCGALTELECNDDSGDGFFSLIELTGQTPGDIIYIRVWEFGNNNFGDFGVCAFDSNPLLPCGLGNVSAISTCTSSTDFDVDVIFNSGTTTSWIISDGTNTATVTTDGTMGPHTFNTTALGFPSYPVGTNVTITVSDDPATAGCTLSSSTTFADCSCFGSIPSNDNCANPIDLGVVPATGSCTPTTIDFTCTFDSNNALSPSCDSFGINLDAYYQFTAPAADVVFSVNSGTNMEFAIWDDCPNTGGAEITCNGSVSAGDQVLLGGFVPGNSYILQVWTDDLNANVVEFCLEESDCDTPNNICTGAIDLGTIGASGTCDGYTVSASVDFLCASSSPDSQAPSCDTTTGNLDVFFSFVAPPGGDVAYTGVTGTSAEFAIYDGGCPSIGTELICQGNTDAGEQVLIGGLIPGNTYIMQIWVDDFNANLVEFCLEESDCDVTNGNCAGAIDLGVVPAAGFCDGVAITASADFVCASASADALTPSCDTFGNLDFFYTFTAPPSGSLVYTGVTGNDGEIAIYDGGCPGIGTEVFCVNNIDAGQSAVIAGLTGGTVYTMQFWVDDFNVNFVEFCLEEAAPAPPQDLCSGAIELPVTSGACGGPLTFDNTSNSDSGDGTPSCAAFGGADSWFFITIPASGNISVETSDAGGFTDSGMSLWSGACGTLTEIDCDDDGGDGLFSLIELTGQTPGDIIYVQVWEFGGNAFGDFGICAFDPNPILACGLANLTAFSSCSSLNDFEVNVSFNSGTTNTSWEISDGTNSAVVTTDGTDGPHMFSTAALGFPNYPIGTAVNITVTDNPATASCSLGTIATAADCSCFGLSPSNDECVDAIPLSIGFGSPTANGPFTNSCASSGLEFPGPGACWLEQDLDNTVWFTILGTGGIITVETNNIDATIVDANTDTQLAIYDGCPGSGALAMNSTGGDACDDDGSANGFMSLTDFQSVPGLTYYVLVDGWNGAEGEFTVDVESDVPPCTLNATANVGDCNPDGTFDISFNVFGQNLTGDVTITDQNGNNYGDFAYMDPFTQISTVLSGDVLVAGLFTEYEISITSVDAPDCSITLTPFDVPQCVIADCPTLFNASASLNVACSGDEVIFSALLNPADAENGLLSVESGTGLVLIPDFGLADANGMFTTSLTLNNDNCAPVTNEYVIRLTCTDDGSTSAIQSEDITIYPSNIEQFISINATSCDASVTIDAGCEPFIDITTATSFTANPGESGSWDVCYEYFSASSPGCFDATGCIPVAYDCPSGCTNDAGTVAGNTFLCDGEFVSTTTNGAVVNPGSTLVYVLHDGSDSGIGNIFASASTGVFMQDGSIPTNVDLCITAVVGDNLDANGIPDGTGCYDISNCYQIVFLDPIVITAIPTCSADGTSYTVDVSITGGGPAFLPGVHTFEVTGLGSFFNGQAFQIGPFAAGSSYSINISDDGKGCTASTTGSMMCDPILDCDAGTMPNAVQYACAGEFVNSNTAGAQVGAGLTLTYVLHNGNDVTLGTVFGTNSTGLFTNDGSIPRNVQLCITAVVGTASATGLPDNICDISNCQPVVFLDPVVIDDTYVCNDVTNEADVTFSITGGGPSFLPTHTYNVIGDFTNPNAQAGVTYAFTSQSGDTYTITVVDDGKGCGATTTSEDIQCNKLPVELISYTGEVKTNGNLLKWATASEIENDYFTLEVSSDGVQFAEIHTEAGNGTTGTPNYYSFLDRDAVAGTSYYRLWQTDFDGTTVTVGIVELTRGESTLNIVSIQPNPVVSDFEIIYETPTVANVSISIIDLAGKVIFNQELMSNAGLNNLEISAAEFPSGIYFVKIITTDYIVTEKFVKD